MPELSADENQIGGALNLSSREIANQTVLRVLTAAGACGARAVAVRHPRETVTCVEKLALFREHPFFYAELGNIRVARGTVICWRSQGREKYLLFINDSDDRIDWKDLKRHVNLSKKEDIGPYHGDVEEIVGLPRGGVSPFVGTNHRLDLILFDRNLLVKELTFPDALWDFAFSRRHSVFFRPTPLFAALGHCDGIRHYLHWGKARQT
mgnify:CR=1 FL=1